MPGPPRKPSHLKAVEGNAGKRPINHSEPKPKSGYVPPPDYFSLEEDDWYKEIGDHLSKAGIITELDSKALEMLTLAYSDYREARELVKEHGVMYQTISMTGAKVWKANPAVNAASDAWKRFRAMATEFGMTPASRTKVEVVGKSEDDVIDDLLNRKSK